jgi:hypothetical protein
MKAGVLVTQALELRVGSQMYPEVELLRREAFLGAGAVHSAEDEFDFYSTHLVLWLRSEPVAAARIVHPPKRVFLAWTRAQVQLPDDATTADISRVAVSRKMARYGLSRLLVPRAFLKAYELGYASAAVIVEEDGSMATFLRTLGFVSAGPSVFSFEPHLPPIKVTPMIGTLHEIHDKLVGKISFEVERLRGRGFSYCELVTETAHR